MLPFAPVLPLGTGPGYCEICAAPLATPFEGFVEPCWRHEFWAQLDDGLVITYATQQKPYRIGSDIYFAKHAKEPQKARLVAGVLYNYLEANADVIHAVWKPDLITYVDAHPDNIAERGFNFIELIVNAYPDRRDRHEIVPALRQVRPGRQPMTGRRIDPSTWELREGIDVQDKRVLVIDDVLTRGTTQASIAQQLRSRGAAQVFGLAIARWVGDEAHDQVIRELGDVRFEWATCRLRAQAGAGP